jgi:CRP/FNR family cyclic AMP-dependent transcriptional regulator
MREVGAWALPIVNQPEMANAINNDLPGHGFDLAAFLSFSGPGRTIIHVGRGEPFFAQGDRADSVFYLQRGRARISVISSGGKEATIRLISA